MMEDLNYKGYTGSIEYSESDRCFYGKILGMAKDAITYEGDTIEALKIDFEEAIDHYLGISEERGAITI